MPKTSNRCVLWAMRKNAKKRESRLMLSCVTFARHFACLFSRQKVFFRLGYWISFYKCIIFFVIFMVSLYTYHVAIRPTHTHVYILTTIHTFSVLYVVEIQVGRQRHSSSRWQCAKADWYGWICRMNLFVEDNWFKVCLRSNWCKIA